MKKIILATAIVLLMISCKKDEFGQPKPKETTITAERDYDYFISKNLAGSWTRVREVIKGALINIDHVTSENTIPVTLSYWYSQANSIRIDHGFFTITNYKRLGSTNIWHARFSSNDAFSLSNYVENGIYKDTEIIDYYVRVN